GEQCEQRTSSRRKGKTMWRTEVPRPSSSAVKFFAATLVAILASGCSKGLPTQPSTSSLPEPQRSPAGSPAAVTTTSSYTWTLLPSRWVNKTDDVTVSGGRYSVHFVSGSLRSAAQVTIQQRDPSIVDFIVGPMGTSCGSKSPTVVINYAGSNADVSLNGY